MKRYLVIAAMAIGPLVLAACGGGGTSTPAASPGSSTAAQNSIPVIVDNGPTVDGQTVGVANVAYVSVKLCEPGNASSCVTVDHVMVDTGSSGLRIVASALGTGTTLPAATADGQQALAECTRFVGGYSWGAVRRAHVHLGGESALDIPVQIISDASLPAAPPDCSSAGSSMNDVASLLSNGILGIGNAVTDCGSGACAASGGHVTYYACTAGQACTGVALPASQQVVNPVAAFASDNNGTLIQLPAVGAAGAENLAGTLTFGIGTQPDNALGSATVQTLDPSSYTFLTSLQGKQYAGFVDSGSNFYVFADSAIPQCAEAPGVYCPGTTLGLTATNTGLNGASVDVDFSIADALALAASSPDATAVNDVAAASPIGTAIAAGTFDWGLPFFYGRSVYTAIEGRMAAGTMGPWVGYGAAARP